MDDTQNTITTVASEVLQQAGFQASVAWHREGSFSRLLITTTDNSASLIGKDGQHLDALEHIIRLVALRRIGSTENFSDFYLDVNNYRKTRHETLLAAARQSADRVRLSGRAEALAPMTAHERKIVHTELASYTDVQTESIGTEPNRRIVIKRSEESKLGSI